MIHKINQNRQINTISGCGEETSVTARDGQKQSIICQSSWYHFMDGPWHNKQIQRDAFRLKLKMILIILPSFQMPHTIQKMYI